LRGFCRLIAAQAAIPAVAGKTAPEKFPARNRIEKMLSLVYFGAVEKGPWTGSGKPGRSSGEPVPVLIGWDPRRGGGAFCATARRASFLF